MAMSALTQLAETMAVLGALGLVIAMLNLVALRVVRVDEVPGCVQPRIRWWGAHNTAFLMLSAAVAAVGVAILAATAI
jgi:hypothetical protein